MNGGNREHRLYDDIGPDELTPRIDDAPGPAGMESRTEIIVNATSQTGQPVIDRIETTGLGPDGMLETTQVHISVLPGCSHIAHIGAEVGGLCADGCGRLLCASCAANPANLCRSCRRPVAGPCQHRPWLGDEEGILCGQCWHRWSIRETVLAVAVIAALAAILYVFVYPLILDAVQTFERILSWDIYR